MFKKISIISALFTSLLLSDFNDENENNVYYLLPGPNLVSFNVLPESPNVTSLFSSIEDHMISIINEGEISIFIENEWAGSLNNINNESGYWVIVSDITILDIEGSNQYPPTYFLMEGANLISYPYSSSMPLNEALPFYMNGKLHGIIGQNEAALIANGQVFGSLTTLEPNKGYWFLMSEAIPFQYNNPTEQFTSNIDQNLNNEIIANYNQSSKQSIHFINNIYLNGTSTNQQIELNAFCNNILVGHKIFEPMIDLVTMGDDTFDYTEGYCNENEIIRIFDSNNEELHIIGNNKWKNNDFSIINLSNFELGDLNFDNNINITDIIYLIEYIISNTSNLNDHQLLLSDYNQDQISNVTDIILIIETILD